MLLRIFDDDTPLLNTTKKRDGAAAADTNKVADSIPDSTNGQDEET